MQLQELWWAFIVSIAFICVIWMSVKSLIMRSFSFDHTSPSLSVQKRLNNESVVFMLLLIGGGDGEYLCLLQSHVTCVCGLLIADFCLDVDGMEKEFIWRTMSQFVLVLNPTCDFIWPPLLTQQSWPDLNNVSTQDRCVRGYLSACVCVSMCVWVRGHAWVMRKLLTCFHQNSSWTVRWRIHGRSTNSQPGYLSASRSTSSSH